LRNIRGWRKKKRRLLTDCRAILMKKREPYDGCLEMKACH